MPIFEPVCGKVTAMDIKNRCKRTYGHDGDCDPRLPRYDFSSRKKTPNAKYFNILGWDKRAKTYESDQEERVNALLEEGINDETG